MTPIHSPALAASAACVSIAAAAWLAGPLNPLSQPSDDAGPPWTLQCRIGSAPGQRTLLRLTNHGIQAMATGTRFAWAALGTPAAQGEVLELPRALARGESITVASALAARGSGCVAVPVG